MQEPSHLGEITLESIWFRMVLTGIITRVYKDSLGLTYPPKCQYLTNTLKKIIPTSKFFDTIVDVGC